MPKVSNLSNSSVTMSIVDFCVLYVYIVIIVSTRNMSFNKKPKSEVASSIVPVVLIALFVAIVFDSVSLSIAYHDTFELSNYHNYNVSLEHDNSSLFSSNDSSIKWSVEPNATFYKFTYADDLEFVLNSSYDTNSTSNETACSYFITLHDRYDVHITLLNESLTYCTLTGYWN